jgi:hypothetical protein
MKIRPEPRTDWLADWEACANDPYVMSKLRRRDRIRELMNFINSYIPELKGEDKDINNMTDAEVDALEITKTQKLVIDIGVGFCEFLEISRAYGMEIRGIDAPAPDKNGMGVNYHTASKLMAERQEIPVSYDGFDNWIKDGFPIGSDTVGIYHSCGSLDFVLREFCEGEPGQDFANDSKLLSFVFDKKSEDFLKKMFSEIERTLIKDGIFAIHMNPVKNQKEFADYFMNLVKDNFPNIDLTQTDLFTIFKFVKRGE